MIWSIIGVRPAGMWPVSDWKLVTTAKIKSNRGSKLPILIKSRAENFWIYTKSQSNPVNRLQQVKRTQSKSITFSIFLKQSAFTRLTFIQSISDGKHWSTRRTSDILFLYSPNFVSFSITKWQSWKKSENFVLNQLVTTKKCI